MIPKSTKEDLRKMQKLREQKAEIIAKTCDEVKYKQIKLENEMKVFKAEHALMLAVLDWYADINVYTKKPGGAAYAICHTAIQFDEGQKARNTLKQIKGDK